MAALLGDLSVLDNEDAVRRHNCGEPVGDYNARLVLKEHIHGLLDKKLRSGIQR
ncbi:hypothetical protein D3C73_1471640 [compost metagenome]